MTVEKIIEIEYEDYYGEFSDRYSSCSKKLYVTALMILRNASDAEDAVQDTVILALKNFKNLRNEESFQPWILRILINRCNRMKFTRFRFNSIDPYCEVVWKDEISNDSILIRSALLKLDYKYRVVIILRFFNDLTIKQISEILKIPEGTIKSQLHRALNKLKHILKEGM